MPLTKKRGLYESGRISYISVDSISPNPSQPRKQFDGDGIAELAGSIRRYGILQPLTIQRREGGFYLISGERRLRAAKLAGLSKVPCIILDVNDSESSVLALVENLHRRDLDFVEEAEGLSRLITDFGLSQEEAAAKVGKSQSAVANKLRILKLPREILTAILEAGLTERHARALLRIDDNDIRLLVLEQAIHCNLSVARTEELIDQILKGENPDTSKKRTPPVFVLKDVRLFLNTVSRGMWMMKQSGIDAEYGKDETDTHITLTIKIPKEKTG